MPNAFRAACALRCARPRHRTGSEAAVSVRDAAASAVDYVNVLLVDEAGSNMLSIVGLSGAKVCESLANLVKSFPTSTYLQKTASIQRRTSLSKFGGKFNLLFIRLLTQ